MRRRSADSTARSPRDEAIAHAAEIVAATPLPVSADLENVFADYPEGVAETIELALGAGLAGCSVEDYGGDSAIYDIALATERVAAAAEIAHGGGVHLVLTGRAENFIRGNPDLGDTIARLAGLSGGRRRRPVRAGLSSAEEIRDGHLVRRPARQRVGSRRCAAGLRAR